MVEKWNVCVVDDKYWTTVFGRAEDNEFITILGHVPTHVNLQTKAMMKLNTLRIT